MQKFFHENEKENTDPGADLRTACEGLIYISETDAPFTQFSGGPAESITKENAARDAGLPTEGTVEELSPAEFFRRLTQERDWFGDAEKQNAKRFAELQKALEGSLRDLKVFRVGRVQIDILVVGIDANGNLSGVRTNAVET